MVAINSLENHHTPLLAELPSAAYYTPNAGKYSTALALIPNPARLRRESAGAVVPE
jgi:hypothetical protein